MTCQQCGAACQGGLCRQCEIELKYAHLTDDEGSVWDTEEGTDE